MLNSGAISLGVFDHPLNDYKGFAVSRILHDFYELDAQKVGFCGGGGLDARFDMTPIGFALNGLPPDTPQVGKCVQENAGRKLYAHDGSVFTCHFARAGRKQFFAGPGAERCVGFAGSAHDL